MGLTAASAAASAGLSAIPSDAGTPIAEKLIEPAGNFGIILAIVFLEKYLLTIFGTAAFGLLVPVGCVLGIIAVMTYGRLTLSNVMAKRALKLVGACGGIAYVYLLSVVGHQHHRQNVSHVARGLGGGRRRGRCG